VSFAGKRSKQKEGSKDTKKKSTGGRSFPRNDVRDRARANLALVNGDTKERQLAAFMSVFHPEVDARKIREMLRKD